VRTVTASDPNRPRKDKTTTALLARMGGLLDTLSHIEDRLLCADPEDDVAELLGAAATAAGDLWAALRAARGDTTRPYSLDDVRLALHIPLSFEAVDLAP
jgi:hypothetical protein